MNVWIVSDVLLIRILNRTEESVLRCLYIYIYQPLHFVSKGQKVVDGAPRPSSGET